ncbi:MAG: phenazine biosynthesis protein PhzF family protein [Bacillota bacterium]|nr:MAG: phenazine biosynthesis protein PhzF family protein [Bacillota bacterium]MBS3950683.1 PhzF family phenazine biosynthesis protein [Peptococcaceae bacterium]
MKKRVFYILDVFAEQKYAGNQLAVIRDATELTSDEMQLLTREMNYSESTFVLSDREREGGYDVRIFTPGEEVPFAGHPTLGTAFIVQQEVIQQPVEQVILNLKVGQIPVRFTYRDDKPDVLWMKQVQPEFWQTIEPSVMAELLQIDENDIDISFPIQEVSTGLPFMIVPLKSLDAVRRARPDTRQLLKFVESYTAKNVLVFAPETYSTDNQLNARVFTDYLGIPEDPATGSANGCLAGYLVKYRYFGEPQVQVRVEQGYEMGRPSLLLLDAREENGGINIRVGGKVILVAKGELE